MTSIWARNSTSKPHSLTSASVAKSLWLPLPELTCDRKFPVFLFFGSNQTNWSLFPVLGPWGGGIFLWVFESYSLLLQASLALGFMFSEQDHVLVSSRCPVTIAFSVSMLCLVLHPAPEVWLLPSLLLELLENICTFVWDWATWAWKRSAVLGVLEPGNMALDW